jgi:O-antigen ligase
MSAHSVSFVNWIRTNLAVILLITTLFLFISKSLYNLPIGIMAVLGAWYSFRHARRILRDLFMRNYILLFLCLWIPLLVSFADTVTYGRSAETVFPYLRFLFFGIYVLYEIRNPGVLDKIQTVVFILVAFWCIDAVVQLLFSIDLFGYPYRPGDITGMFYPRNTIAHVTACLSPFYFEVIRKRSDRLRWLWLLLLPLVIVILCSGRRAAWIMFAVSCAGYLYYLCKLPGFNAPIRKRIMPIAVVIGVVCATAIATHQPLQDRITNTMGIFSGDYQEFDMATARRLPIWNTAVAMFKDNWINGVGARGFRYAYRQYSNPDDYWIKSGGLLPTTQPHQIILEVLAETGMIGAAGLVLLVYVFYRLVNDNNLFFNTYPCLLAIFVAIFPFNTNMAFYGSYWASMFWWLVVLAVLSGSIITAHAETVIEDSRAIRR